MRWKRVSPKPSWMQRLKRVFHIDIEYCGVCGGTLRVVACIETPELIERILTHLTARNTECIDRPRAPPLHPPLTQTMNDIATDRVGPMQNPPHLGELIRESMDDAGWNVTETAARLGCERGTLSRLLNGKAGVSANMAPALEDIGWGTAEHWMRMQASYELAQARRDRIAAERSADALHA